MTTAAIRTVLDQHPPAWRVTTVQQWGGSTSDGTLYERANVHDATGYPIAFGVPTNLAHAIAALPALMRVAECVEDLYRRAMDAHDRCDGRDAEPCMYCQARAALSAVAHEVRDDV